MAVTEQPSHVFRMAIAVVILTSAVPSQATYDTDLLNTYARASQQLRSQTFDSLFTMGLRINSLQSHHTFTDVTSRLMADMAALTLQTSGKWTQLSAAQSTLGLIPVLKLQPTDPYTDANKPMFGDAVVNHGMEWYGQHGTVIIRRSGVYFMEIKVQGVSHQSITTFIYVFGSDNSVKYMYNIFTDWEVTPHFRMMQLEAGDTLLTTSLALGSSSTAPHRLMAGPATQLLLRFLG